ncbi:MAG: hypothetical protein R3C61_04920 [Bacteroidia bacterium]
MGLWLLGLFTMLFLGLSMLISFPKFQSWLVMHAQVYISGALGTRVSIERVSIAFPYKGVFEQVVVDDCNGETLVKAARLQVNMISFSVWNFLFKREDVRIFKVSGLDIIDPEIFVSRTAADSLFNFDCILRRFQTPDTTGEPKKDFVIDIASVHMENGKVIYADSTASDFDSLYANRINLRHLRLDSIATDFSVLYESAGSGRVEMYLNQITAIENFTGLKLEHLSAFLVTGEKPDPSGNPGKFPFVELSDLSLRAGNTWVKGDVWFPNTTFRQLIDRDFNENFEITLKDSRLEVAFVNYFLSHPLPLKGILRGEGQVNGNRKEIHARNFFARYLNQTRFRADIDLLNYLDTEKGSMDVTVDESRVSLPEIQALLPTVRLPSLLTRLQLLSMTGSVKGGFYDFRINAQTSTDLGSINGNLRIQLPPKVSILTYEGFLITTALNVDQLAIIDRKISNNLNFEGNIKGRGISPDQLDARVDAKIIRSDLMGFYVDSLYGDVKIADHVLAGHLAGGDGIGDMNLQVDLDLSTSPSVYKLDGVVNNLSLSRYGLYPDTILFSAGLHVDLKGDSIDEINGVLRMAQARLTRPSDTSEIRIPDLLFYSDKNRFDYKYILLKSSIIDADIAGNFSIRHALQLTRRLAYESSLYLANEDSLIREYYAQKIPDTTNTNMRIGVAIRDSINQIFHFLNQPVYISPGSRLEGTLGFEKYDQMILSLNDIDSISINQVSVENVRGDLTIVKQSNKNQLNLAGGIYTDTMKIGENISFDKLFLNMQGEQDTLSLDLTAYEQAQNNGFRINLHSRFFQGGRIEARIDPKVSNLMFKGQELLFNDENTVIYNQKSLDIRNLQLGDDNSYLRIDGIVSTDSSSKLNIDLGQLDIAAIQDFYPLPFSPSGKINADAEFRQLLSDPAFYGVFKVEKFALDGFDYGEIFFDANWQQSQGDLYLDARLINEADTTLALVGKYAFNDSLMPINFNLITQKGFPLDYIYPFVKTQLFGIQGNVELEEFTIKGDPQNLKVNGVGHFEDAGFGVEYFQTHYTFDGKIYFDNDRITFPRITLYDPERNHADFHGVIRHRGLREFDFDLQMDQVKNFLVMNTRKEDNDLFYGTMYVKNGIADITGDLEKLKIQAIASSGPRSRLRIPITYEDDLGKPEFVHFTTDKLYEKGKVKTGLQDLN